MTNVPNHIGTSQLICIDCFLFDGEHWSLMGNDTICNQVNWFLKPIRTKEAWDPDKGWWERVDHHRIQSRSLYWKMVQRYSYLWKWRQTNKISKCHSVALQLVT